MNKEEKLKADLENNYYIYEYVKDKSKLELIDLLRDRDERIQKSFTENITGDTAYIKVYDSDGKIIHEIKIGGVGDDYIEYGRSYVFNMAQSLACIYDEDDMGRRIEVTFEI